MLSANHSAYGFNNFYPSIVRGFNLGSNTITLVCTAPPYLVGALITFAMAYNSDRINERGWHIIILQKMPQRGSPELSSLCTEVYVPSLLPSALAIKYLPVSLVCLPSRLQGVEGEHSSVCQGEWLACADNAGDASGPSQTDPLVLT